MTASKIKANYEVDQTPGKSVTLSLVGLLCQRYVDGTHVFLPFPFYTKNADYSVSGTRILVSDVGYVNFGSVRQKNRNGVMLTYDNTGSTIHRIVEGNVTITFA